MSKNVVSSGSDYGHLAEVPCSCQVISKSVISLLQKYDCKKILDIGCGNGSLMQLIHNEGIEVIGIEPSESGIEEGRKKLPKSKFYCMGVYDNPCQVEENNMDAIISTEVIEHLFYPQKLIEFAKTKLKQDGFIILTTPYHGYLKNLILSITGKWDAHHAVSWDGGHIKFWSKSTLSRLLKGEGFEIRDFIGCGRVPYVWKSMLLCGQLKK